MAGWIAFATIGLIVVFLACWTVVRFTHGVIEARHERERLEAEERAVREEAEERAWYEFIEKSKAFWRHRLTTGTVLDLESDRRPELMGKAIKAVDNIAHRHTLRKDVHLWCKQNCAGEYGMVVFFHNEERAPWIWFSDPNDAFAFKMRWY